MTKRVLLVEDDASIAMVITAARRHGVDVPAPSLPARYPRILCSLVPPRVAPASARPSTGIAARHARRHSAARFILSHHFGGKP